MINWKAPIASLDITSLVRQIAETARASRRRMRVNTAAEQSARPTIYFLTPDYQSPSGGIRVIYRHVDILNQAGIAAFVLHQKHGFRCNWFENNTPVVDISRATILQGDLLVVSELDVDLLEKLPRGVRYVVFNQNAHLTWLRGGSQVEAAYTASPDFAGVLTVSNHNLVMLSYAFPHCRVERVHLSIEPAIFYPGAETRSRRIAYMPRRARDDAVQVLAILKARGALSGWEIAALDGLSRVQVADELRRSQIFLAFTHQEGFGLPAAEAMACGCYVIGNHGYGGQEFFASEFSTVVEPGDALQFAQAVENVISQENNNQGWCAERGHLASEAIRQVYTDRVEREDVVRIFSEFLQGTAA